MIRFKFVSTFFFQYGALKGTIMLILMGLQCKYYTETIICIFSSGERETLSTNMLIKVMKSTTFQCRHKIFPFTLIRCQIKTRK